MKNLLIHVVFTVICLSLFGCQGNRDKNGNCLMRNKVFTIITPCAARQEALYSIDSYAGEITFDSISMVYDYMLKPPSDHLTREQYLLGKRWLGDIFTILPLKADSTYSSPEILNQITFIELDTINSRVKFAWKGKIYEYTIRVPEEIASTYTRKIPIDNRECRLYYSTAANKALKVFMDMPPGSSGQAMRLSFVVRDLLPKDTAKVIAMLKTVKVVDE